MAPRQISLTVLGRLARGARALHLGRLQAGVRDALDRVAVALRRPPLSATLDGRVIRGFLRHRSFLADVAAGYEPYTRDLFERSLKPDMIVVDGGAHIGVFTVTAARKVGPAGRVLAFEPDPYNYRALVRNVAHTDARNVSVKRMAVSNTTAGGSFFHSASTISGSLVDRGTQDAGELAPVETTTIDHEVAPYAGRPLLVKLDIEGAEPLALEGMRGAIEAAESTTLFVEVNSDALLSGGTGADAMLAQLRDMGFAMSFIDEDGHRCVPIAPGGTLQKGNLLCTR